MDDYFRLNGWLCACIYICYTTLGGSLFSSFVFYGRNTWHSTVLWMPLMGKGMVNYKIINETKNSHRNGVVSLNRAEHPMSSGNVITTSNAIKRLRKLIKSPFRANVWGQKGNVCAFNHYIVLFFCGIQNVRDQLRARNLPLDFFFPSLFSVQEISRWFHWIATNIANVNYVSRIDLRSCISKLKSFKRIDILVHSRNHYVWLQWKETISCSDGYFSSHRPGFFCKCGKKPFKKSFGCGFKRFEQTLKIAGNNLNERVMMCGWKYLHRCILVRWDPIISRNSGDNRLVCEMFSCQMNVHHPPFCVLLCLCCISRLVVKAHATRIKCGWLDTASSSMFHIRRYLLLFSFLYSNECEWKKKKWKWNCVLLLVVFCRYRLIFLLNWKSITLCCCCCYLCIWQ